MVITTSLSSAEWVTVFEDAKMTTALLDRITHPCDILETGDDCFRFKHRKQQAKSHWPTGNFRTLFPGNYSTLLDKQHGGLVAAGSFDHPETLIPENLGGHHAD